MEETRRALGRSRTSIKLCPHNGKKMTSTGWHAHETVAKTEEELMQSGLARQVDIKHKQAGLSHVQHFVTL